MKKRSQVYRRMSTSYILVVSIFILVVFVGYVCSYSIIRKQALFYNEKLLETIKSVCDREVENYNAFLYQLNFREKLNDYVSRTEYESSSAHFATYQLKNEMTDIMDSLGGMVGYCYGPFVYVKSEDMLVSPLGSPMTPEAFGNAYFEESKGEEVRQVLKMEDKESVIVCRSMGDHKRYVLLFNYLVDNKMDKGKAVVGMWLNLEALTEKIDSVSWDKNVDWAIVNDEGEILLCSPWLEEKLGTQNIDTNAENLKLDDGDYLLNSLDSGLYNWKYVLLTNKRNISNDATRMEIVYFVCALVLLCVGYESIKILLKLHYDPIKELVATVSDGSEEKINNEYQFLEKRMNGILSNHREVQSTLSKSNKVIKAYLLETMLTSSSVEKKELAICEEIYNKFAEGENVVMICRYMKKENGADESEEEKKLDRFILFNVFEEEVSHYFSAEVLELDDYVAVIINLHRAEGNYLEVLRTISQKLKDFLHCHFGLTVCSFVGNAHHGVEGIHQSYLEACEAEAYLENEETTYLCYDDIYKLPLRSYEYSFNMEERLYNAVRSGNEKLACSYVEVILNKNLNGENVLSADLQNCLFYDIYGTLLKAAEGKGIHNREILTVRELFERADIEEISRFFYDRIRSICDEVSDEEDTRWKKLCQSVLEYIRENYTNPDLNLSQTAQHFNLSPGYLAANYKKHTGSNILDIIKEMRMEHSKVLLKEGLSIREVAERVGFRESSTFVRFFKNCAGMTPSQMREMEEKSL